jgi:phosphoribosylformylglycinamidine synthase
MDFIGQEAEQGKVVIGNCNGAQILIESGLVPLGGALDMSLARNIAREKLAGFLSEWVWITPACKQDRCATSDWKGAMHVPIAHGEGRFTTRDKDLLKELIANDQIAFRYCDEQGITSDDPAVTPNGAVYAIAGLCNPAGNVVALMPHPERTPLGKPYFASIKKWIETRAGMKQETRNKERAKSQNISSVLPAVQSISIELFIDTIITNNEERTVEAAARRVVPDIRVKQLKYVPLQTEPSEYLRHIAHFNPNKEVAYILRGKVLSRWNSHTKSEEQSSSNVLSGMSLLRRDQPFDRAGDSGICYVLNGIDEQKMCSKDLLEIFANPHASTLERIIT